MIKLSVILENGTILYLNGAIFENGIILKKSGATLKISAIFTMAPFLTLEWRHSCLQNGAILDLKLSISWAIISKKGGTPVQLLEYQPDGKKADYFPKN